MRTSILNLLLKSGLALLAVVAFRFPAKAQASEPARGRMIVTEHPNPIAPLHVVNFKFDNQAVEPGVAFNGGDDWLSHMSVTVRNMAKKTIAGIGVRVDFLDTGDGSYARPLASDQIFVGAKSDSQSGEAIPLQIVPGEEEWIPFAPEYEGMKTQIAGRQTPLSAIRSCRVLFNVYFSDGTSWQIAHYYAPDPTNPHRSLPTSYKQFVTPYDPTRE